MLYSAWLKRAPSPSSLARQPSSRRRRQRTMHGAAFAPCSSIIAVDVPVQVHAVAPACPKPSQRRRRRPSRRRPRSLCRRSSPASRSPSGLQHPASALRTCPSMWTNVACASTLRPRARSRTPRSCVPGGQAPRGFGSRGVALRQGAGASRRSVPPLPTPLPHLLLLLLPRAWCRDGKSRCFGFVGFRTPADAEAAVKYFDRSFFDTMRLAVEVRPDER